MKSCGCKFCNDLRNIEPAKYIGGGDEDLQKFLKEAANNKQFIYHFTEGKDMVFAIVDKCPECGYEFTEEDYDSYL